jgi:hypothetical protein
VAENPAGPELCRRPARSGLASRYHLIPTGEGWLYLAVILDLFTPKVAGLIHHSDRGKPNTPPATTATSCRPPRSSSRCDALGGHGLHRVAPEWALGLYHSTGLTPVAPVILSSVPRAIGSKGRKYGFTFDQLGPRVPTIVRFFALL